MTDIFKGKKIRITKHAKDRLKEIVGSVPPQNVLMLWLITSEFLHISDLTNLGLSPRKNNGTSYYMQSPIDKAIIVLQDNGDEVIWITTYNKDRPTYKAKSQQQYYQSLRDKNKRRKRGRRF